MEITKELVPFQFKQFPVRAMTDGEGEPWMVAKDICEALGIVNSRRAIANLDTDEKGVHIMNTPGGAQSVSIVNEAGFYKLALRSRKVEAKDFQRWVTHEVLPSLRRTGSYSLSGESNLTGIVSELVGAVRDLGGMVKELLAERVKVKVLPAVPEISTRLKISQLIRSFVARQTSGYSHQDAFDQLYYQFKYHFNIDLPRRAKNANYTSVMDYAEAQGLTEQVYAMACKIFTEI